ncbi:hypothetical protein ER308_20720 [Egibacter rhizosphaerae]|uniref:Oxidoreductase molybdopterin-binding domain-containing protein n=1 Tax=Egibacter rhizosphaerae TaxID=1670831 RepID=A0A411YKN7_9ACTN|nr:molybdopterin-dependent oxidoreductase [Egibacter rhizosphaerae]QBI21741.1 hypothetical protein ER308_20720 [Egibacter rhizosphaerae]
MTVPDDAAEAVDPARAAARPPRPRDGAIAGAVAVTVAFAVGEVLAATTSALVSPIEGVGDAVVAVSPPPLTDAAIAVLGPFNVLALQIGIVLVALGLGALVGRLGTRRALAARLLFVGIALAGGAVAAAAPAAEVLATLLPAATGALVGMAALWALLARARSPASPPVDPAASPHGIDRRGFVRMAATFFGVSVVGAGAVRSLSAGARAEPGEIAELPEPNHSLPAASTFEQPRIDEGLSDLWTPNDEFYIVDTAVRTPHVEPRGWSLTIDGRVDNPIELSYDELLDLAGTEADILLTCVSNPVGGGEAGTARWQGVRLGELLDRAGLASDAEQIVGESVEGFTAGFPVEAALDGRDALVAVGMNGEPLPRAHGFPARLVVAGLYGYVSATKWLERIHVTGWNEFDGFWVPRGWAKEGPVRIQSRIDTPHDRANVVTGTVPVGGVAWAPLDGIERVEVSVDGGDWQPADLGPEIGGAAWRQWTWQWENATAGTHELTVRATDATGEVQTAEEGPARPDGATGRHTVTVRVEEA